MNKKEVLKEKIHNGLNDNIIQLTPFVKWAGGKRQLLPEIKKRIPKEYNCYFEPFVGGGAVMFDLQPEKCTINDKNRSLINTYRSIKEEPDKLIRCLKDLEKETGLDNYYKKRDEYNKKILKEEYDIRMAGLFLYLNKHCFNGLYRVNKQGLFNVPYNQKNVSIDIKEENIFHISNYLKKVKILEGDFEIACKGAKKGDFIFFDSPYDLIMKDSFQAYTKDGFQKDSHERLAKLFRDLDQRGCYCMLTNNNTEFIKNLYNDFYIEKVSVKRYININSKRRNVEEIIICNYR